MKRWLNCVTSSNEQVYSEQVMSANSDSEQLLSLKLWGSRRWESLMSTSLSQHVNTPLVIQSYLASFQEIVIYASKAHTICWLSHHVVKVWVLCTQATLIRCAIRMESVETWKSVTRYVDEKVRKVSVTFACYEAGVAW